MYKSANNCSICHKNPINPEFSGSMCDVCALYYEEDNDMPIISNDMNVSISICKECKCETEQISENNLCIYCDIIMHNNSLCNTLEDGNDDQLEQFLEDKLSTDNFAEYNNNNTNNEILSNHNMIYDNMEDDDVIMPNNLLVDNIGINMQECCNNEQIDDDKIKCIECGRKIDYVDDFGLCEFCNYLLQNQINNINPSIVDISECEEKTGQCAQCYKICNINLYNLCVHCDSKYNKEILDSIDNAKDVSKTDDIVCVECGNADYTVNDFGLCEYCNYKMSKVMKQLDQA